MSKLKELGKVLNGKAVIKTKGIYPAYGGNGIIGYVNNYNYPENTIIIGRVGANCGVVHFSPTKCWVTDNALAFSPINGHPYFVFLLLDTIGLNKFHIGSSQPLITQDIIANIDVDYIKDFNIQKKIAELLLNIDNKIALNKSICSDLERLAKEIYDYWFVQFDFPNENGKPYKSSGGKMVWNEALHREIPQGWEVKPFSFLCSMMNGINYNKNETGDKEYHIVNVRNITASNLLMDENDFDTIVLKSSSADRYAIHKENILIARSGTPGAVRLVQNPASNTIFSGFIIQCTPRDSVNRFYLTYAMKMLEGTSATKTGGSILQNVSQDTLGRVAICVPSKDIVEKFNNSILKMYSAMQNVIEENYQLVSLRDFLLPMLMNGQIKIEV